MSSQFNPAPFLFIGPGCPKPLTGARIGLGALDCLSLRSGLLTGVTSTRQSAPPSFTRFQPRSHGQNLAIEIARSPSLVLASSDDLRPPGTHTRLVSGDFTAMDRSGAARSR